MTEAALAQNPRRGGSRCRSEAPPSAAELPRPREKVGGKKGLGRHRLLRELGEKPRRREEKRRGREREIPERCRALRDRPGQGLSGQKQNFSCAVRRDFFSSEQRSLSARQNPPLRLGEGEGENKQQAGTWRGGSRSRCGPSQPPGLRLRCLAGNESGDP